MKHLLAGTILCCLCSQTFAQVDVAHRRILTLQTGHAIFESEEALNGYGYFWFNEDDFPWEDTALRVNYALVYLDAELSYFLPVETVTAVGVRLGGGLLSDNVTPYIQGERISSQSFEGDSALGSVFINHEITKIAGKIPLNVRATYKLRGTSYREGSNTHGFKLPHQFYTQTAQIEIRLGGLKREITAREGLTAYVIADTNYRTDFEAYGPKGALYEAHTDYQRLLGNLGARIPIKETTYYLLLTGATGRNLDQLSAWRLGGNLVNADPTVYSLHGYYTKEFFARDFGLANFEINHQINEAHNVTLHLYADCALANSVPPDLTHWRTLPGAGAGVGFRTVCDVDVLVNYGYGFNAVRNGDRGGHEIGLALEKQF